MGRKEGKEKKKEQWPGEGDERKGEEREKNRGRKTDRGEGERGQGVRRDNTNSCGTFKSSHCLADVADMISYIYQQPGTDGFPTVEGELDPRRGGIILRKEMAQSHYITCVKIWW